MSIIFDFATCIQSGQEPTGCARNGWTIDRRGLNLNVEEFFAVKQQNGLVPLFTCGCGNFDCSGYYTDVSCTDTALILRNGYHRFNRSLQAEFEYHLDWQQVRGIAEEILTYLQKIHARNPRAYVTTGYTGENLIDCIPDYRKSLLLIP